MLPAATVVRTPREITQQRRSGRSLEISRLISRTLRTITNLSVFSDATIMIDCDVLQADGGTRAASITGSYLALLLAQDKWLQEGLIENSFLLDSLAAVSVGISKGRLMLDPDYVEDAHLDADFNFVMTGSGLLVEVHGGAERNLVSWQLFDAARQMAQKGINELLDVIGREFVQQTHSVMKQDKQKNESSSLFSLKARFGTL